MIETEVRIHPRGNERGYRIALVQIANSDPPSKSAAVIGNYLVTVEERDAISNLVTDYRTASVQGWNRERNVLELVGAALEAAGYDPS